MVKRFWWGTDPGKARFMALKPWKNICLPKYFGGLSFQIFREMHLTMLAKLGWSNLLRAKYLKNELFFEHELNVGASSVWQGIMSLRSILKKASCFKLRNDISINPWKDPWIPGYILALKEGIDGIFWSNIAALKKQDEIGWNFDLLKEICEYDMAEAISRID